MQQAIQIRRAQTTVAREIARGMNPPRRPAAPPRTLGATEVNLPLLFWSGSLLLRAAYFLGGGEPERPLRQRKARADESSSGVVNDAVSALRNLGYSRSEALRAVNAARRDGARSFDAVMGAAMKVLA